MQFGDGSSYTVDQTRASTKLEASQSNRQASFWGRRWLIRTIVPDGAVLNPDSRAHAARLALPRLRFQSPSSSRVTPHMFATASQLVDQETFVRSNWKSFPSTYQVQSVLVPFARGNESFELARLGTYFAIGKVDYGVWATVFATVVGAYPGRRE